MKATELMIGDLVKVIEPDRYAGAQGIIRSLTSQEGVYYAINISDVNYGYLTTDVFNEDIEPIPLTKEILEKNGFEQIGKKFIWGEIDDALIEITPSINNSYRIKVSVADLMTSCNIWCSYVHELQHALRLCGIEKEIEL